MDALMNYVVTMPDCRELWVPCVAVQRLTLSLTVDYVHSTMMDFAKCRPVEDQLSFIKPVSAS